MNTLLPFRDINVHASNTHYSFSSPSNPSSPSLLIDRPSGNLSLTEKPSSGAKRVTSISGILGIVRLRLDKYIIVITKAAQVGRIKGNPIYKIQATEFLPLREKALHDPDEDTYLKLLTTHLKNGPMYFSYSFDLTNSFQRQVHSDLKLPLWKRADDRFFWNRHVASDLIDLRSSHPAVDPYILPVMFGMMEIRATAIKSTPLSFILITRRSRFRAGTRYFSRGVDDQGHVSNFNETEQIVIIGDSVVSGMGYASTPTEKQRVEILSYVQTRGSVPVFWSEINNLKFVPKLQIRNADHVTPARRHFAEQVRIYGDNYMVNLVNQSGREANVKAAYEQVVRNIVSNPVEDKQSSARTSEQFREIEGQGPAQKLEERIHYIFFDFHHECKGMRWHRALLLLDEIKEPLIAQKYFHMTEAPEGNTIKSSQTSVVRSNCMDCLDRTNVVQSMLARYTIDRQLKDIGVLSPAENIEQFTSFEFLFRNVWADNADVVSKAYSGTGALKTDFTRTGKRTVPGALSDLQNSLTRYWKNNFLDGPRQDAYDLFLGAYLPSTSGITSSLLFVDRRPVFIQSVPYILAGAVLMLIIAGVSPSPTGSLLPIRFFMVFWALIAGWCGNFMKNHGMLYVNWPKLNNLTFANEGYNDALFKVSQNPIVGRFVARPSMRHERGQSSMRMAHLEEGKKRIE